MRRQLYIDIADYPVRTHQDAIGTFWYNTDDLLESLGQETRASLKNKRAAPFHTPARRKILRMKHIDTRAAEWLIRQLRPDRETGFTQALYNPQPL